MENLIKNQLQLTYLKRTGKKTSGDISSGKVYECDKGLVFLKENSKKGSDVMFKGEFKGLQALKSTNTVTVPNPLAYGDNYIVMEYLDIKSVQRSEELGTKLAELHLFNLNKIKIGGGVKKFGFECDTCCGFLPMDNTWSDDWADFYINQRLKPHVESLNNPQLNKLWDKLEPILPNLFEDVEILPSLLHGDLWSGNMGEVNQTPVVYDPSVFYGHHEFDLAIGAVFGGFNKAFHEAYHSLIPKADGFESRQLVYELFHYLNHWRHFGVSYKVSTITTVNELIQNNSK